MAWHGIAYVPVGTHTGCCEGRRAGCLRTDRQTDRHVTVRRQSMHCAYAQLHVRRRCGVAVWCTARADRWAAAWAGPRAGARAAPRGPRRAGRWAGPAAAGGSGDRSARGSGGPPAGGWGASRVAWEAQQKQSTGPSDTRYDCMRSHRVSVSRQARTEYTHATIYCRMGDGFGFKGVVRCGAVQYSFIVISLYVCMYVCAAVQPAGLGSGLGSGPTGGRLRGHRGGQLRRAMRRLSRGRQAGCAARLFQPGLARGLLARLARGLLGRTPQRLARRLHRPTHGQGYGHHILYYTTLQVHTLSHCDSN